MKAKKVWTLIRAMGLVGIMSTSAMAVEVFQERFEWGDLSKPTTMRGRVAVIDPYDKAVWVNIGVFGGNAESGYYWQKDYPGRSLKLYAANDEIFKTLISVGKASHNQAVSTDSKPSNYGLVEIVVQEVANNKRVIQSVKMIEEIAGIPGHPRSLATLGPIPIEDRIAEESRPDERFMKYDFMIPDGKIIKGFISNSAQD